MGLRRHYQVMGPFCNALIQDRCPGSLPNPRRFFLGKSHFYHPIRSIFRNCNAAAPFCTAPVASVVWSVCICLCGTGNPFYNCDVILSTAQGRRAVVASASGEGCWCSALGGRQGQEDESSIAQAILAAAGQARVSSESRGLSVHAHWRRLEHSHSLR